MTSCHLKHITSLPRASTSRWIIAVTAVLTLTISRALSSPASSSTACDTDVPSHPCCATAPLRSSSCSREGSASPPELLTLDEASGIRLSRMSVWRVSWISCEGTGLPKVMLSAAPGRGKNLNGAERPSGMSLSKP